MSVAVKGAKIRPVLDKDVPSLLVLAREFWKEGGLSGEFNEESFLNFWSKVLLAGTACFYVAEEDGAVVGAIAGLLYPDPLTGVLSATESFWFMSAEHRRGRTGLALLDAFEAWAISAGARRILMVHLEKSMPDRLRRLYERRGYGILETHYCKEV